LCSVGFVSTDGDDVEAFVGETTGDGLADAVGCSYYYTAVFVMIFEPFR
jgi:hypothetical protein